MDHRVLLKIEKTLEVTDDGLHLGERSPFKDVRKAFPINSINCLDQLDTRIDLPPMTLIREKQVLYTSKSPKLPARLSPRFI